jgi:hypothetical protein
VRDVPRHNGSVASTSHSESSGLKSRHGDYIQSEASCLYNYPATERRVYSEAFRSLVTRVMWSICVGVTDVAVELILLRILLHLLRTWGKQTVP